MPVADAVYRYAEAAEVSLSQAGTELLRFALGQPSNLIAAAGSPAEATPTLEDFIAEETKAGGQETNT